MKTYQSGLLKQLHHLDPDYATGADRLAQVLVVTLHFKNEQERLKAVHKLIEMGGTAVEPPVKVLADLEEQVCELAAVALFKIGYPAVQPLIDALYSDNEQTRLLAASVLQKLGYPHQGEPGWNLMCEEYRKRLRCQRERAATASV